jgi:putative Mn2+ efflux pump MntP
MNLVQVVLIAVGLSADAFAVSVAEGVALREVPRGHALRVALHFGGFQAIMPVVGWLAGTSMRAAIAAFDHWVAFGLLVIIGLRMLVASLRPQPEAGEREPSRGARLLALSVATSVDALAVGVSLSMLEVTIWEPALIIGAVTGVLCATGIELGDRVGSRLGRRAEALGGAILCAIGVKVLVEHIG